jgi:hypothetical protein
MEEKRSAFRKMTEIRTPTPAAGAATGAASHTQVIFTDHGAGVTFDVRFQSASDCSVRALPAA